MKRICLVSVFLAFASSALAQSFVRSAHIWAPVSRLISGEQVQLYVIARDNNGQLRGSDRFSWNSSDTRILTVDSDGVVTARGLGVANISADTVNARTSVRLEVLPLRVDVTPPVSRVPVGAQILFTAVAVDIGGQPIPNVSFQWQVVRSDGNGTAAARIDSSSGVLIAAAVSELVVRALINYPGGQAQFVNQFLGTASVEVFQPPGFKLTRLLSSEEVLPSVVLRPPPADRRMAVNERGQVAFIASLDGVALGLLRYDNGNFELLGSTGMRGPLPESFVNRIDSPAINNLGDVLAYVGNGLMLATRSGNTFVFIDGQSEGGFENIRYCCSNALNDRGDIVFRASYRSSGSSTVQDGLFFRSSRGLELIWAFSEQLPGLSGMPSLQQVGIDNAGNVFFVAGAGPASALYSVARFDLPVKQLATGDNFAGSKVRSIDHLAVATDGGVAVVLTVETGQRYLVRNVSGKVDSIPLRDWGGLLSPGMSGVFAFWGDAGRGWGVYRWSRSSVEPVFLTTRLAPNGEPVRNVNGVGVAGNSVFLQLSTNNNGFVVTRPDAQNPLLFQSGDRLNVTTPITINGFVAGFRDGAPLLRLSSFPVSIFELNPGFLIPRMVPGDRLPGGSIFVGANTALGSAGGLYISPWGDRSYRISSGGIETVIEGYMRFEDGVDMYCNFVAVNDAGTILLDCGTNRQHSRLAILENSRLRVIAYNGTAAPWIMSSPGGGTVRGWDWNRVAIDERGRVLAYLDINNGPDGLFLYDAGRWQPVGSIARQGAQPPDISVPVAGQNISSVNAVRSRGDRFYASFSIRGGQALLAEYRDQAWTALVARGDVGPNGAEIQGIGTFDVNRPGDIVLSVFFNGVRGILFRSSDGKLYSVNSGSEATDEGDEFRSYSDVILRDDRKVYFIGMDLYDLVLVYLAEPLF